MAIPHYKGIESIPKITSWFLKHDQRIKNDLWDQAEAKDELNNWLTLLFQNQQHSELNDTINVLFHEFTYLSLPQLEEWHQKNILSSKEQEDFHNLLTLVFFQKAQLRISGWIYKQLFKIEFSPFGNPFLILGYFDGFIDYYRILDLPSSCSTEDIKKAYRAKAKILHPDTGGNAEAFKQLKEAYDVLSDEQQRNVYNEKYEFYQNRYDYEIKPSPVENQSTKTSNNERPRFIIKFNWKAFIVVMSCLGIIGLLSPLLVDLNHKSKTLSTGAVVENHPSNSTSDNQENEVSKNDNLNSTETPSSTESSNLTNSNESNNKETSPTFTLGSTKDEVITVMGEPDEKEQFGNVSSWLYQDSSIDFDENEKVASWSNFSHILKVSVGSKKEGAPPFTKGSLMEDVVNAMGTPDEVTNWGAIWRYQNSTVEFDGDTVIGWSDNSGNLLVKE
jgi:curved DNA-binding protein CbpA